MLAAIQICSFVLYVNTMIGLLVDAPMHRHSPPCLYAFVLFSKQTNLACRLYKIQCDTKLSRITNC